MLKRTGKLKMKEGKDS